MKTKTLGPMLYAFFEDYLKCQKGLRPATVRSYRDSLRLFLRFVADDAHHKLTRITLGDLTADMVRRFLNSLEEDRHNHIRSRNQRLSVLRIFFEYLARQIPEMLSEAEQVEAIPIKRVPPPETFYLERDEIQALFAGLPRSGRWALRDRTLLLFLYNTGARVQEVADLGIGNLELEPQPRVHLHGKGDKWRICPLWQETVALLKQLRGHGQADLKADHPVFTSHRGQALTRYGIYKIVRRHAQSLLEQKGLLHRRRVSPHIFRHSCAAHMLESGVDVNVIRAWLGHVSLETTNRYAEINIRLKEAALRQCEPPHGSEEKCLDNRVWRDDAALLEWLAAL